MNRIWILLSLISFTVYADDPKIPLPVAPPMETETPTEDSSAAPAAPPAIPISTTVKDPDNKKWISYDNRIVKTHVRAKAAWTIMEVKEAETIGTVSFTLSRLPLMTFAVVRGPLGGDFEAYLTAEALKPLYPEGFKKTKTTFAGQKAVMVRGKGDDGRMNESYFLTDGKSLYQVSFSAPEENWVSAQIEFDILKRSFRWLR